jgi:hypothetical protein
MGHMEHSDIHLVGGCGGYHMDQVSLTSAVLFVTVEASMVRTP